MRQEQKLGRKISHRFFQTTFIVGMLFSLSVYADEIPFDNNVPDSKASEPIAPPPPEVMEETNNYPTREEAKPLPTPPTSFPSTTPHGAPPAVTRKGPAAPELSGLGNLAPFSDIAMISRRFLPKTRRFEFSPNIGYVINDAFFNDLTFGARLSYYFREQYGAELVGISLATSNKSVTDNLSLERGVKTDALATPTSYFGAAFKWSPIYGKMGLMNKTIIPFDTYFLLGGGLTGTNQATRPPTLHVGTGQLYAISKWMAFRWDFSWFGYQSVSAVAGGASGFYTNLHLTIGMSFFFPGAEYR